MKRVLVLVVWILALSSASAFAINYGAIAYSRTSDLWGASWDQPSQQAANNRALRECGKSAADCAVVVQFSGHCGAYATGPSTTGAAGWGVDTTRAAAEQRAVNACNRSGGPCKAKVSTCNSQPGFQPDPPHKIDEK